MKKFIIIIYLLLASLLCLGQQFETHRDYNGRSYEWELVNQSCYNCASFYMKVMRTSHPNALGDYYYYIYFYSNSFDRYGYLANTYFTDVKFYSKNKFGNWNLEDYRSYILVPPKSEVYDGIYFVLSFPTKYPKSEVSITWGGLSVY